MKNFQNILILLITAFTISFTGCDMNLISDDEDAKKKEQLLTLAAITAIANPNRVTFTATIDGVSQVVNLPALETAGKIVGGPPEGYCLLFTENENYSSEDPSTWNNSSYIILPLSVETGSRYTNSDTFIFMMQYINDTEGWDVNSSYDFELEITEWGGSGGRAKGTFYGTLFWAANEHPTILITNGSFDIAID